MVARGLTPPLRLAVRSCDALAEHAIERVADWRIHSVFARAVNLVAPDGALLGIVAAPADNAPATLVLAPAPSLPAFDQLVAPGGAARVAQRRLIVADRLALDLAAARVWRPAPIRRTLAASAVLARVDRAREVAAQAAPRGGLAALLRPGAAACDDPVVFRARAELARLVWAIRADAWADACAPARALSGLGPGLTPAGDDLLAGLALGVRAALGVLPAPLAAALAAAVTGRTTDLAVAMVRHALAGRTIEAVHALLLALVSGPADNLDAKVRAVLAFGHSSGADTLVGVLAGLEAALSGPEPTCPDD